MEALKQRDSSAGAKHHAKLPVRRYREDSVQAERVLNAEAFAIRCFLWLSQNRPPLKSPVALKEVAELIARPKLRFVELGCGACDIIGHLSKSYRSVAQCIGVDCNDRALEDGLMCYPDLFTVFANINDADHRFVPCDLMVLCEVLEHIPEPKKFCAEVLPLCRTAIISHPLNEAKTSQTSGGDHQWSFNIDDHGEFFHSNGHVIDETMTFQMGAYNIIMSRSHRLKEPGDAR